MTKQLKSLDIIMENLESFTIPAKCIYYFWIDGFKKTLHFQSPNDVFEHDSADFVKLYLINLDEILGSKMCGTEIGNDIVSRLKQYKDICSIQLKYEDDSQFEFYVPWGGDNDYNNEYQYVKIAKNSYTKQETMYIMFNKEKPEEMDGEF